MNIFLTILVFYFGTVMGSFFSVLIHRYHARSKKLQKEIIMGRSMCPHCKTKLEALDLIPLASYLLLKGRCRYCEKNISPHYFWIELITGILFALLYIKFPFFQFLDTAPFSQFSVKELILFIDHLVIAGFLMLICFYDALYREIPDIFSIPPIIIALINGILTSEPNVSEMIIGGATAGIFFQGQILLSKGRWLGGGDVRLGILMGILLGWKLLIVAVFGAYILGAGMSLILLAKKKATRKTAIAFGPYLVAGTFIALFLGKIIINWYSDLLLL